MTRALKMEHVSEPAKRVIVAAATARKKRKREEDENQKAVLAFLEIALPKGCFVFHVPNGGARSPIEAKILKGLGVKAGVADLVIVTPRQYPMVFLEMKAENGPTSEAQLNFLFAMEQLGHVASTAVTVEDAYYTCQRAGLPMRARPQ